MQSDGCDDPDFTKLSDREFAEELRRLCDVLSCSVQGTANTNDWDKRLVALRQLCKLARGDVSKCRGFLSLMGMYVKVPLQHHIEEVRTLLSTEACAVVVAFAEHSSNRTAWRAASEWFIPSLLQLTMRTNRVSLLSAVGTLGALARTNSFGPAAFAELLRGCTARHAATRRNALGVLQVVMKQGQNDDGDVPLSKSIDAICRVLRFALSDADEETRRCARSCFWTFHASEPEAAERLYKGMENPVKRSLARKIFPQAPNTKDAAVVGKTPVAVTKTTKTASGYSEDVEQLLLPPHISLSVTNSHGNIAVKAPEGENKMTEDVAESWALVHDALQSTLWSERLLGLRRLSEGFLHFRQEAESVRLLIPRLNDPNSRVAQMALQVLQVVMRTSPTLLKVVLPDVVTALLVNMSGNKEALSNASREHLASIIQVNAVDDVARAIYRTLGDVVAPRVKVHAVEYAQYLYEQHAAHFEQSSPMTLAMTHLLQCLRSNRKGGDVYKAAISSLAALYVSAETNFVRTLLQLSPIERDALVETLEPTIPHLAQECRRRVTGERPLQHAPLHICSPFAEKLRHSSGTSPKCGPGIERQRMVRGQGRQTHSASSSVKKEVDYKKVCNVSSANEQANGGLEKIQRTNCEGLGSVSAPTLQRSSQRESLLRTRDFTHRDSIAPVGAPSSCQPACKSDDPSDLLVRLDETYGVVDVCAVLDRVQSMIAVNPTPWLDVFGHLLMQLERLISQSCEPNHVVRRRGILVLRTVVEQKVLQRPVTRCLKRIVLLARVGIDDVFPEVHVEATAVLQTIFSGRLYPIDHILNSVAMSLENWLSDDSGYSSSGWLMLLESVEHLFARQGRGIVLVQDPSNEYVAPQDSATSGVVSEPVFSRLCGVVLQALRHAVTEVRLTAVLVVVSIWMSLDTAVLPYLVGLTASQRKLVSLYYNKITSERMPGVHDTIQERDLTREMRAMGLPEPACL
ncbi:putative CLIP-associating protein 1-like [Trypanosoma rangeli]|uniref:Putative CLIP-associating protein 1-like n=1 Tax=Trypanosoma rangeli TaxID=5698 RepID=A0A3R7M9H6_TRYRA|nr:putative CLIP-associating protein 1-like [Trypanosoma rangeli]RNF01850.1 putative CLIP-associating protein 1-like [Trypanosoma rangeli]|eukprot:RNF01850.1 putative CLIP-associating protein 1-like [Trypanosoma rangeli]